MPLYEYRCTACGHKFEKIQSFSAPDEKDCPKCGGAVERLLSAPAIQFKGSGFYKTDYARSGSPDKGSSKNEGGSKNESGSKSEGSSSASDSGSGSSESSASAATPKTSGSPSGAGGSSSPGSSSGSKSNS